MFLKTNSLKVPTLRSGPRPQQGVGANSGFTLIELLVVIAIIGLLSSIVLASLSTARLKAKDAAIKEDMIGIRSSAALYFSDQGNYGTIYDVFSTYTTVPYCPTDELPLTPSMFHQNGPSVAKSINNAIKHIKSNTGPEDITTCFSNGSSYAVVTRLNEIGVNPSEPDTLFCVDSQGAARTYNSANGDGVTSFFYASTPTNPYMCSQLP